QHEIAPGDAGPRLERQIAQEEIEDVEAQPIIRRERSALVAPMPGEDLVDEIAPREIGADGAIVELVARARELRQSCETHARRHLRRGAHDAQERLVDESRVAHAGFVSSTGSSKRDGCSGSWKIVCAAVSVSTSVRKSAPVFVFGSIIGNELDDTCSRMRW